MVLSTHTFHWSRTEVVTLMSLLPGIFFYLKGFEHIKVWNYSPDSLVHRNAWEVFIIRMTFKAKIKINKVQKSHAQHICNCTKEKNVRRPYCRILTIIVMGAKMNTNFFHFFLYSPDFIFNEQMLFHDIGKLYWRGTAWATFFKPCLKCSSIYRGSFKSVPGISSSALAGVWGLGWRWGGCCVGRWQRMIRGVWQQGEGLSHPLF